MARFWWVRHGPTHSKALIGHSDIPADLSDHAALAQLDAFLPRDAVLVSSDLLRAVQTADCLSDGRRRLANMPELREFNFGAWDGLHFDAISAGWPDLSRKFWETPGDISPPNGESWNDVTARVSCAIDRLGARFPFQDIVIVAHFGVILTQYARASNITPYQALAQPIAPLSVTAITDMNTLDFVNYLPTSVLP